ncbi:ATP-binding protein [Thalassobaculum sp.]|uniref:ATP-binding protein n=1 Tax=Thalassobaculum sp. TaxID=2022740 RepID=UPI0032EF5EA4
MTFRTKVLAFSLTIGTLAAVLATLVGVNVHLIVRDNERLGQVLKINANIRSAEALASEILLSGGERPHRQWRLLSESLSRDLSGLQTLPFATPGLIEELDTRLQSMDRAFRRLSSLANEDNPLARGILASRIRANKDALVSRVAALETEVRAEQVHNYSITVAANLVVIGCLLFLAIAHHVVMRRFLSGAWNDLEQAIHGIANGELSDPISSDRRDEIGEMLAALDGMREGLHTKIQAEDAARRSAEELSRTKSRFIASVSHELRTPLMSLLGLTELADRREKFEDIKRDLKGARSAGRHLLDLINQILDFSKIEADQLDLSCVPFQPASMIEVIESVFAAQASEKGLVLKLTAPAQPVPALMGDPQRLSQVLFNLVGNAIKFTDSGTVTVEYRVDPLASGMRRFRIDVIDTGPGIPEHAGERIFDDFSQLSTPGNKDKVGTGLGLAIAARLVRLMGGRIGLEREAGPGTGNGAHFFVSVDLPAAPAQEAWAAADAPRRPAGPLRILMADDIETNRMIVREILATEGHHVDEAENGLACLEMLRDMPAYDVVLMDINMPVMDGIEATRAIRHSTAAWSNLPVVGLTANAFQEQVAVYLDAGMTACVSKPVAWAELLATLAEVTDNGSAMHPVPVTPDVPVEEPPLVDETRLDEMLRILGEDRVGGLIAGSTEALRESVRKTLTEVDDPRRLASALHGLRGIAANLAFARLADRALALEKRCATGGVDAAALDGLPRLLEESVAASHRWLERRLVA